MSQVSKTLHAPLPVAMAKVWAKYRFTADEMAAAAGELVDKGFAVICSKHADCLLVQR